MYGFCEHAFQNKMTNMEQQVRVSVYFRMAFRWQNALRITNKNRYSTASLSINYPDSDAKLQKDIDFHETYNVGEADVAANCISFVYFVLSNTRTKKLAASVKLIVFISPRSCRLTIIPIRYQVGSTQDYTTKITHSLR
jgi:hypothetical protein